jgi:hypothetical protein
MDTTTAITLAEFLKAGSPWAMLVFMGYWMYRMQEKKDKDTQAIYNRLIQLVENQTSFLQKVEFALNSLKNSVDNFAARH